MTFKVSGQISIDAAQAKTQVSGVKDALAKLAGVTGGTAAAQRTAASATQVLATQSAAATAQINSMAAAQRNAAAHTKAMSQSMKGANLNVANLTAQFNDIGVMLAAGQNPLQLALQQGTQITQVFGTTGAAGAARLLGRAFVSMVSPLNIITIGAIAGGAALFQWATSADESAETAMSLSDHLNDLKSAFSDYSDHTKIALTDTLKLRDTFGDFAGDVRNFSDYMADVSLADTMDQSRAAVNKLRAPLSDILDAMQRVRQAQDALAVAPGPAGQVHYLSRLGLAEDDLRAAADAMELLPQQAVALNNALKDLSGAKTMDDIAARAGDMLAVFQAISDNGTELPAPLREAAAALHAMQKQAAEAAKSTENMPSSILSSARAATQVADEMERAANAAHDLAAQGGKALRRSEIKLEFKDDPVARAGALAALDFDSKIGKSAGSGDKIMRDQIAARRKAYIDAAKQTAQNDQALRPTRNKPPAKNDAARDLIDAKRRELELLRESDPVQREMIAQRTALANATAAQRTEIEALISAGAQENALSSAMDSFAQASYAALDGVISRSKSAKDALRDMGSMILQAAQKALLLGEGPLAGIFGTSGAGLLQAGVGAIFKGFGFANGGMVYGEGGPKDDKVPAWLSAGEFVVNARAAARHRGMLEQINSAPGFAAGGLIGAPRAGAVSLAAPQGGSFTANIDARGASNPDETFAAAKRGMAAALREFSQSELPVRFRQIAADPARIG